MKKIYFDHYRTTKIDNEVFRAMKPYMEEKFYLPESFTSSGTEIAEIIDNSETSILNSLGLKNGNVIFTGSGTMANNLVIHGILRDSDPNESMIISSKISHPSILRTYDFYSKKKYKVKLIGTDGEGYWNLEELKNSLNPKVKLVSITYVNHTIGTVQKLQEIASVVKNYNENIKILVDGSLAVNSLKIDLEKINIDYFTVSGHKIYGPKGVGAIIAKKLNGLKPVLFGSVSSSAFTPGAENIPGIVGISAAIKKATENSSEYREKVEKLRDYMMKKLEENIDNIILNGPKKHRVADNVNYSFRFVEGESVMMFLDFENIVVATGSACASSDLKVNYILSAIGRDHELSHGSLRITLGKENTKEEIDTFIEKLVPIVERLRKQSTIRR
jgi:cysteine desulfurase